MFQLFIAKILISVERICGLDLPAPVSRKQRHADQKNIVKRIVSNLACGNLALQNPQNGMQYENGGLYIMHEDIEALRSKNQKHNFC